MLIASIKCCMFFDKSMGYFLLKYSSSVSMERFETYPEKAQQRTGCWASFENYCRVQKQTNWLWLTRCLMAKRHWATLVQIQPLQPYKAAVLWETGAPPISFRWRGSTGRAAGLYPAGCGFDSCRQLHFFYTFYNDDPDQGPREQSRNCCYF